MLEARLEKRCGTFTLRAAFTAENETLALLGVSGAGKTMTLQCLAGIVKPDCGYIAVDGKVWFDSAKHVCLPPQERAVGLLFQQYALFPNMTVWQNLLCGLRHDTPRRERAAEAKRLVERMCLNGLEDRLPSQLSGGQQQRVALARCLARKPKLLLLDEPFAALDTHLRWLLEQELMNTLQAYEGTALYVTHDREEARRLCRRVCVINAGRSQPIVDTDAWFHTPATRSAAQLAGFENIAAVRLSSEGEASIGEWAAAWPCGNATAVGVAFRAEDARFQGKQEDFKLACRILRSTEQEIIATPTGCPASLIRAQADRRRAVGDRVMLHVARDRVVWLQQEV